MLHQRHAQERELSALRSSTRPLQQAELPLAGYLFARNTVGTQVDRPLAKVLVKCNEAVLAARRQLRHGRGNVVADVESSGGDSVRRAATYRRLRHEVFGDPVSPASAAAAAAYVGAGYCDEHGFVAAMALAKLVAEELGPGHEVKLLDSDDHRWAELWIDAKIRVVCDPWCDGPAILSKDHAFKAIEVACSYDHEGAADAVEDQRTAMQTLEAYPRLGWLVEESVRRMEQQGVMPKRGELCDSMPVVSKAFRTALQDRLATPQLGTVNSLKVIGSLWEKESPDQAMDDVLSNATDRERMLRDLRAVGARDAGWSVKSVVSATEAIVTAARDL